MSEINFNGGVILAHVIARSDSDKAISLGQGVMQSVELS